MDLNLDLDRQQRCGFPEVVYGAGKTDAELVAAATGIFNKHAAVLATRVSPAGLAALQKAIPSGEIHQRCHCFCAGMPTPHAGPVAVVSAGTTDGYVAEEAALTLRMRGVAAQRRALRLTRSG